MGELRHQAYILSEPNYLGLFWTFVYVIIIVASISYYIARKDKSEVLALFSASLLFVKSGLTDLLYFTIQSKPIPENMYWLIDTSAGFIAKNIFNLSTVTPFTLVLNTVLFCGIGFYLAKWLVSEKW